MKIPFPLSRGWDVPQATFLVERRNGITKQVIYAEVSPRLDTIFISGSKQAGPLPTTPDPPQGEDSWGHEACIPRGRNFPPRLREGRREEAVRGGNSNFSGTPSVRHENGGRRARRYRRRRPVQIATFTKPAPRPLSIPSNRYVYVPYTRTRAYVRSLSPSSERATLYLDKTGE